jgi:hypothetical protein
MHRGYRCLGTILLMAALGIPLANAKPVLAPQDHEEHERQERENRRVYDPYHKDYHNWDSHEDGLYRHWLEGRHEAYADYERLKHSEQRAYWNWRHSHEEHEEHEHHD